MRLIVFLIALLTAAVTPIFAAPAAMQEGNWELTMKMDMTGMPFAMPPVVVNHCYTKQDLQDMKKTIPSASGKNECETKDVNVAGDKVTWKIQCKDGTTGSGEMVQKKTSYNGTMTMESAKSKGASKMVYHMSGKRTGECK